MNNKGIISKISLVAIISVGVSMTTIFITPVNAQVENQTSSTTSSSSPSPLGSQNTTTGTVANTAGAEEKTYILIFGQRTVGNIDNSTKIVSSIVGNNSLKIQEEFLEEISLAPSQQLEEQINKVVEDGIGGLPCTNILLTTDQGQNVSVDCFSSGNRIIWYIYPTSG
ncbi:MAG: hypothetical protein ACJ71J_06095 [Nitrososphaeraceae archaeon]